jgi:hypothetical protein
VVGFCKAAVGLYQTELTGDVVKNFFAVYIAVLVGESTTLLI